LNRDIGCVPKVGNHEMTSTCAFAK